MPRLGSMRRLLLSGLLAALLPGVAPLAAGADSSGFGAVAIPEPPAEAYGEAGVEPVEVMRREHMNFLLHQRDATVIDGERDGSYALVDCLNCHNHGDATPVLRYEDPGHFCADCHVYAGVSIDCFECHADRGDGSTLQGGLGVSAFARHDGGALDAATLTLRLENAHGE